MTKLFKSHRTKHCIGITLLMICCTLTQGCATVSLVGAAAGGVLLLDRRNLSSVMDDQRIENLAEARLNAEKESTITSHINVVSFNKRALVVGQVPNEKVRQRAGQIVEGIPQVIQVYNQLTVSGNTSYISRSNDAFITSKIKSRMLAHSGVNPIKIKVVTENAIVYLMGLVYPKEIKIAVDIARTTSGVQQVVQLFEPING